MSVTLYLFLVWFQWEQKLRTSFSVKTSLWSLSVSDESGSEICRENFDNSLSEEYDEQGESGSEFAGEGGGDWARYSVISNIAEEILRWPGEVQSSLLLRIVLESWMFFRTASIRSISLSLRSNEDSPRPSQILWRDKQTHMALTFPKHSNPFLFSFFLEMKLKKYENWKQKHPLMVNIDHTLEVQNH